MGQQAKDKDKCKTIAGKALSKMFRVFLLKNALKRSCTDCEEQEGSQLEEAVLKGIEIINSNFDMNVKRIF